MGCLGLGSVFVILIHKLALYSLVVKCIINNFLCLRLPVLPVVLFRAPDNVYKIFYDNRFRLLKCESVNNKQINIYNISHNNLE